MSWILNVYYIFIQYILELWAPLLIGFVISGICFEFIPQDFVEKRLGKDNILSIFIASFAGTLLPVCCFGSLPIAVTLYKKGASLGAIFAFLIATPATSVSALFVCYKLLGIQFTFFIFWAVVLMGIIIGCLANYIKLDIPEKLNTASMNNDKENSCCPSQKGSKNRWIKVFSYAFITLPKEIGLELLAGIFLASVLSASVPIQNLFHTYLHGINGYIFSLLIGLLTYVCSTASIPLAHAFIHNGIPNGAAMIFLIVGPVTSYGALIVLKKSFGNQALAYYLSSIILLSVIFGVIFQLMR